VAVVEAAFVIVILLVLTLGLIQWGIIFNTSIGITNLSREGARYAAVHYDNDADIRSYINSNLPPGIRQSDLKIDISPPEGSAERKGGQAIKVTLSYDMSKKLFLPNKMFGPPYTITFFSGTYRAVGQMMMEP
jgi:Flp pilus assembly protein TadG